MCGEQTNKKSELSFATNFFVVDTTFAPIYGLSFVVLAPALPKLDGVGLARAHLISRSLAHY